MIPRSVRPAWSSLTGSFAPPLTVPKRDYPLTPEITTPWMK